MAIRQERHAQVPGKSIQPAREADASFIGLTLKSTFRRIDVFMSEWVDGLLPDSSTVKLPGLLELLRVWVGSLFRTIRPGRAPARSFAAGNPDHPCTLERADAADEEGR